MTIILCPSFVNSFARKPGQMNDNLIWTLHCCTFNGVRFAALKLELRTDPNLPPTMAQRCWIDATIRKISGLAIRRKRATTKAKV